MDAKWWGNTSTNPTFHFKMKKVAVRLLHTDHYTVPYYTTILAVATCEEVPSYFSFLPQGKIRAFRTQGDDSLGGHGRRTTTII